MIAQTDNKMITIELESEADSEHFAIQLAHCLVPQMLITLSGEIGTGKTTIIRALLKELGVKSAIKSPTFSLVESYDLDNLQIHHFDLYRLQNEEELEYLGFRDYFFNQNICIIEWAEHAGKILPRADIHLTLTMNGAGRSMLICIGSDAGEKILACLAGKK